MCREKTERKKERETEQGKAGTDTLTHIGTRASRCAHTMPRKERRGARRQDLGKGRSGISFFGLSVFSEFATTESSFSAAGKYKGKRVHVRVYKNI